ncbi:aldehyde dehydrogenase family protein [Streptomyces pristinaespiralis]|uniref:Aldehyde dehydrogenase n=2 Tax=Streptomyces pristinaespiralis TaxID=38300 RepID=B5HI23_STRE2|nr:aldehyde dehydrogenase family protein [Streptomyces pristinaespiralis]ALC19534.1 dehydrogenase [Streptomyces pristinaespiralis]EDY66484.1 aldehyde dehydrogenase [Streptomyces pristinaespiralis ATCC 25486]QMU17452.1 aldehyde dehydrogenase family protein [Streptomyces pristinaespiralis]
MAPTLTLKPGTAWTDAWQRCAAVAPEAFRDDRVLNLWAARWHADGRALPATSPVDQSPVAGPPRLDTTAARQAVRASLDQHRAWRHIPLPERRARVAATLDALAEHRELLALLLVWEIGKPWRLAQADVDRAIDGVRWYVEGIEPMLDGRSPLGGPVSNIASWNYPMSVLVHAMLVQALAGNAVIAKAPTDGGVACLTLACALAVREGVPLTLVSGSGGELSEALVRSPEIGCVSFVGGRDTGARIATAVADLGKRHILEQEGLNTWGVWNYTDFSALTAVIPKLFDYGKQRCTAYPRFVVQCECFADFLAAYLPAVRSIRTGHPLAVEHPDDPLPALDFGPLINAAKAKELGDQVAEAIDRGAVPLHRGTLADGRFLPGQDTSAYLPPVTLLGPPPSSPLHHAEPFGPVDTIVLVDTEAELLAAMNASGGALVATLSTDDPATFRRLAPQIRAFKTGHNKPRSRGDRDELFGGFGASWRGAFVGGELLVRAVTEGPAGERLPGNFPDYQLNA